MTTPKVRLQKWGYEVVFATYMIIRAVVCSLYPVFTLYFTFQKTASFSHAEIFKYVFKYLVCGYFADDVVEVEDAFAEVLADEVA